MSAARKLYEAGYTDLVSVMPPDAELSPNSSISPDQRGKVPGLKGSRGWYGYKWDVDADIAAADRIDRTGANLGIRGRRFPALDIDAEDPGLALAVVGVARDVLGPAPVRLSRDPRRLLMYRTRVPFKKRAAVIQYRGRSHTIEMLADGQQFLIRGTHPSGTKYKWESLPPPDGLTYVTEEKVDAFFEILAKRLGAKGVEVEVMTPGRKAGTADPVPDKIAAGARNATLASIAGTFRSRNLSRDVCLAALKDENERRCEPPLADEELGRIVASIYENYDAGHSETVIPADEEFSADPTAAPRPKRLEGVQTVGEVYEEPFSEHRWLVEDMLPAGGLSLFVAKPKVGKSTLARALAVSVATGQPFLDREVLSGPVLYLMFFGEGSKDEWHREMKMLGAPADAPIHLYRGQTTQDIMERVNGTVGEIKPALVIVDTMQNVLQASDLNEYALVGEKFGPMFEAGAHMMLIHHAKKGENLDLGDGVLGSTKIFGSVEVGISLKRDHYDRGIRYMEAIGRDGIEIEPTVVGIYEENHHPYVIGTRSEVRGRNMEHRVLALLADHPDGLTKPAIESNAKGRGVDIRGAVDMLVTDGALKTVGEGVKGDPTRYVVAEVIASDEFDAEEESE
jgi:hypothetical protein